MAFNGYLTNKEIGELAQAALNGGLLDAPRQVLLAGIPPAFAAAMAQTDNRLDQFTLDLVRVNAVERMAGGDVPVLILLRNAANRLRLLDRQEAAVFERALSRAESAAGVAPQLRDPTRLTEPGTNGRTDNAGGPLDATSLPPASGSAPEDSPAPGLAAGSSQSATAEKKWRIGSWDVTIRAALISGAFVIIAALIALIPFLLGASSGNPQSGTPSAGPSSTAHSSTTSSGAGRVVLPDPSSLGVRSVAFSYDGKWVATADANGNAYIWAMPAHTMAHTLHTHTSGSVNTVAFSENGKLATGNARGHIYLWAGGRAYEEVTDPASKGVNAIAFTPGGQYLAAADANGHTYLWNLATRKIIANLPGPSGQAIQAVAFSADGKLVAAGDRNGKTYISRLSRLGT
jgi:WD40 repeat protein